MRGRQDDRSRHQGRSEQSSGRDYEQSSGRDYEQSSMRTDETRFRSDDGRAGIYGGVSQSDRTYDSERYRPHREAGHDYAARNENYDRTRDWNRTYNDRGDRQRMNQAGRGGRDFGYGTYGTGSGFRTGAEAGGYGRDSDFGAFDRGDDLVFGSPFGRGAGFSTTQRDQFGRHSGKGPKGYKRSDDRIQEEVCEMLERHPLVDASSIEVTVKDGLVTLSGSVEDRNQKRLAEIAVENCRGVKDVQNRLSFGQTQNGGMSSSQDAGVPTTASRETDAKKLKRT